MIRRIPLGVAGAMALAGPAFAADLARAGPMCRRLRCGPAFMSV